MATTLESRACQTRIRAGLAHMRSHVTLAAELAGRSKKFSGEDLGPLITEAVSTDFPVASSNDAPNVCVRWAAGPFGFTAPLNI
jgi:hypothetical protein